MTNNPWIAPPGLEGVVVAETAISDVDGAAGRLTYRGRPIEEIVRGYRFEELVPWLVTGEDATLPSCPVRPLPAQLWPRDPMAALAAILLFLAPEWPVSLPKGLELIIGLPEMFGRIVGDSGDWPTFESSRGPAERYLTLVTGKAPSAVQIRALNAYWVMAAEHSLNASTFAVRIAASTGAQLPVALAAGVAVLSGPLHGGAPEGVLSLLEEVARRPADLRDILADKLRRGERLMGFGHRVYRRLDPRARALRGVFLELAGSEPWADLALRTEKAAQSLLAERHPERVLATNVEFYAAAVLKAVGIPSELCPPTFALARMAGWTAHWWEQAREGRLIRPLGRYRLS